MLTDNEKTIGIRGTRNRRRGCKVQITDLRLAFTSLTPVTTRTYGQRK